MANSSHKQARNRSLKSMLSFRGKIKKKTSWANLEETLTDMGVARGRGMAYSKVGMQPVKMDQ